MGTTPIYDVLDVPVRLACHHVDYVRMTYKRSEKNEHQRHDAWRLALAAARKAVGSPQEVKQGNLYGYAGTFIGNIFVGEGESGVLLQASGVAADFVARKAAWPDGIPRLDIASTIWGAYDVSGLVKETCAQHRARRVARRGRPPQLRYIDGFGDGDTFYIGKRGKRTIFQRVYDKEKESGLAEYEGAIRYETEYTDAYAREAFRQWRLLGADGAAAEYVNRAAFTARQIPMPRSELAETIDPIQLPAKHVGLAKRIAWLQEGVAPALDLLREAGIPEREIATYLGLRI